MLSKVERALAGIVEGTTEKVFTRRVQPVHIARRLEAAMEDGIVPGTQATLVPNYFAVRLDLATYERFGGAIAGLQADFERHLTRAAARRRMRHLDPVLVELRPDRSLARHRFTVEASFTRQPSEVGGGSGPSPDASPERTMVMPALRPDTPARPPRPSGPRLEVSGVAPRSIPLDGPACTIGRSDENDVVLPEPAVSRHHATVRREGDRFLVHDAGSANGVLLNGRRVNSAPLSDGDRLLIGTTELVFRR